MMQMSVPLMQEPHVTDKLTVVPDRRHHFHTLVRWDEMLHSLVLASLYPCCANVVVEIVIIAVLNPMYTVHACYRRDVPATIVTAMFSIQGAEKLGGRFDIAWRNSYAARLVSWSWWITGRCLRWQRFSARNMKGAPYSRSSSAVVDLWAS